MRILFTLLFAFLFSISNAQISLNMSLLDQYDVDSLPDASGLSYNDVWGYADCDGSEYAILGSASRVHFINVTDPTNIQEVASFAGGEVTIWRDMKTYKDRAYAVSDNTNEGLLIFDLSDLPNSVSKTYHSNEYFGKCHDIFIDEENGRLYAVGTNTRSQGVIVFDLTEDPDNPTLIASVDYPGGGYVHDLYVKDNIAYCSHGYEGFYIWDMTNAASPVLIASQITGGYNHSSTLSEDGSFIVYAEEVPTGMPLGVLDISNMHNGDLNLITTFKFPLLENDSMNTPHNPYIRGNYIISSYYEDGVQVFDVSDPENPMQVAYYDTHPSNNIYTGYAGNWGVYPYLPSGIILASDIDNGLMVLSLDSLQLAEVESPMPPDISEIFESAIICIDESVQLELPNNVDSIHWFKNGEQLSEVSNILTISEAGTYSAVVYKKHCSSESNEIMVYEQPSLEIMSNGPTAYCEGNWINLSPLTEAESPSYLWLLDGETFDSTEVVQATQDGLYELVIVDGNACTSTAAIDITIYSPETPTVSVLENTLTSSAATYYQWYGNNEIIIGANEQSYTITESGDFYVATIDQNGCSANSVSSFVDFFTSVFDLKTVRSIQIFPNPTSDILQLDMEVYEADDLIFEIWSTDGRLLLEKNKTLLNTERVVLNVSSFAKGMYFVKIKNEKGEMVQKFVKI